MNAFGGAGLIFFAVGFSILITGVFGRDTSLIGGGAACMAVASAMATLWVQGRKEEVDISKFYLDSTLAGFKQAHELLGEYERTRWIAAARILLHIREIRKRITEVEHQHVFRMYLEDMRLKLAKCVGHRDDNGKVFFGKKADESATLYDAAASSTEGTMGTYFIDTRSLAVLYEFARETDEHDDVLDQWGFDDKKLSGMEFTYPGLFDYIKGHERYWFRGGKIVRKSDDKEITAEDPDFR